MLPASTGKVIEAPERWATFDDEPSQLSMQELDRYDAFVMGRVSYERFRENWGAGGNPYIDRIGAMPKYVASRSLAVTLADRLSFRSRSC